MKTFSVLNIVLGLIVSTILSGCIHSSTNGRNVASVPRHVIISVHGIGGGATTFGQMGEVLAAHMKDLNPNYQYEYYNFTYKKDQVYNNTFQYAEMSLNDFIVDKFKNQPLRPEDKISFVAHSQGGLVTMIWYVDTLISAAKNTSGQYREDLKTYVQYAKQVENIVTVGTPFWGSKLATRLSDPEKVNLPMILGMFNPAEMKDMSFNSNTVYKFRRSTISLTEKDQFKDLFTANLVNIGGIFPKDEDKLYYKGKAKEQPYRFVLDVLRKVFFDIGFGGDRYEADVAVLAPSSRLGFLYADDLVRDNGKKIIKGDEISGDDFREASFFDQSKWIMTESLHSPISEKHNVGMAYIPQECSDIRACDHPVYRYILFSLANCSAQPEGRECRPDVMNEYVKVQNELNAEDNNINSKLIPELQGYEVELVLRLPDSTYDLENPAWKKRPGVFYYTRAQSGEGLETGDGWRFSQDRFFKRSVELNTEKDGRVRNTNKLVKVFIAEDIEPISKVVSWKDITFGDSGHTDIRLHLTGYIAKSEEGVKNPEAYNALLAKGVDVPITVDLPGLKVRKMVVRVKPGYSTFVEAQMTYDGHQR